MKVRHFLNRPRRSSRKISKPQAAKMSKTPTQKYFSTEEWENMPEWEKDRHNNTLVNFLAMQKLGFNPPLPEFMRSATPSKDEAEETQPSKKEKDSRKRKPRAGQKPGSKKVMTTEEVAQVVKYMESKEDGYSAADKLRALQLTLRQDFHGFDDADIASSQAVTATLKACLKYLEARVDQARIRCDEAEDAVRKMDSVDLEARAAVETSSARNRRRRRAKAAKQPAEAQQGAAAASVEPPPERAESGSRYPRRQRAEVNYEEPELPEDDEYLYCDRCLAEHPGVCPHHGKLQFVVDRQLPKEYREKDRAARTLPPILAIGESCVKGAGLGVWTRGPLPLGAVFGPYEGQRTRVGTKGGYSWVIKRANRIVAELDAADSTLSNWMRYVNCAVSKSQFNFAPFQFQGRLYYRTTLEVPSHTELMTWYGDEYARKLGIDVRAFHKGLESLLRKPAFSCHNCDLSFTSPIRRDRHERASCRQRRFDEEVKPALPYFEPKPKIIPSAFELSETLNEPGPETKKKHRCGECSYSTDRSGSLKQHVLTHTGEKAFSCPHCVYKCTQNGHLQQHLRTHTGDKPFACTLCDFKAVQKGSLAKHMLTHTGDKPFQCTECEFATTQSSSLLNHVRAKHSKEHPYACKECEYTCVQSSHLTRHMTTHTGVKKLACQECTYACNWPGELKKHQKAKHAAEASQ